MKILNKLKSKKDVIDALKEIFFTARQAQIVYKKNEFNIKDLGIKQEEYEQFSDESKEILSNLFNYSLSNEDLQNYGNHIRKTLNSFLEGASEDEQIEKLKMIIEGIIFIEFGKIPLEEKTAQDIPKEENNEHEKSIEKDAGKNEKNPDKEREIKFKEAIICIRNYYSEVVQSLEKIQNEHYEEQLMINFYKESKELGIHIDNEREKSYKYGDFIKLGEETNNILYKDENMVLTRMANYQTMKSLLGEKDKISEKSLPEKISKYKFYLMYEKGKMASIEFFGDPLLGDKISKGSKKTFNLILSAACEAKERNREFIGRISCIDRELGTFITTYDDNLEEALQRLLVEEKMKVEETSNQQEEVEKNSGEQPE